MATAPRALNLGIGELILVDEPAVISTVLGSCVSVCLFSDANRAGGMIHYALPSIAHMHGSELSRSNELRFGDRAVKTLIENFMALTGERPGSLSAKLIGGASDISGRQSFYDIGNQNIAIARELLAGAGIRIVGEDVGGIFGRKVIFHVPSGRVQVAGLDAA